MDIFQDAKDELENALQSPPNSPAHPDPPEQPPVPENPRPDQQHNPAANRRAPRANC